MSRKKAKQAPKRVLRLPDLDLAKSAVLNTLRSSESKRSYRFAIDDFVAWYCSEPRLAFSKTVVLRYRLELESRRLSASTINREQRRDVELLVVDPVPVDARQQVLSSLPTKDSREI